MLEVTGNFKITITLDGSKLTKQLFHVTADSEMIDIYFWHIKLDSFLLLIDVELSSISSNQSYDNSYIIEMNLIKYTKEGYKSFTYFFNFYNNFSKHSLPAYDKGRTIKS